MNIQETQDIIINVLKASNLSTLGMKTVLHTIEHKIDIGEIENR